MTALEQARALTTRTTCASTTAAGLPCPNRVDPADGTRCLWHSDAPALVQRAALARQRGGELAADVRRRKWLGTHDGSVDNLESIRALVQLVVLNSQQLPPSASALGLLLRAAVVANAVYEGAELADKLAEVEDTVAELSKRNSR